ncbi:MAG TPA: glycosyltransferase family 4 protein [Bacteroidales bacterium]|nr:glycosyltransferase family 4 protein [Bacteroidales bacterium]
MRILSVTNLCHGFAATLPERSLYKGLAGKGADLTVVTHYPTPESEELVAAGIKVVYLPITRKFDLKVVRSLREIIRSEKTEILHFTFGKALTNGLVASRGLNCRIVAYIGSVSLYWHDPFSWVSYLNSRIDRLICLSNGVEKHVLDQAPRRMKGKTARIYKGYETSWFSDIIPVDRKDLDIPEDAFVLGCVANVRKIKGIPWLIRASEFLPAGLPVYFLLIGPGMDSPGIRKLMNRSSYKNNFRTKGFTNDVLRYTSVCDLYVQPSITEGLGRSVIEAMCLGKPILVSGTGGIEELVDEGSNGFFVPAASPEALAKKILFSVQNRNIMTGMGAKSRERIETAFNSKQMVENTWQLFRSLAG